MDESIPERMTTVVRGLTDEPFTIVANSALEDPSVSFKAKGLLVFMCSRPTDWHFTREWLTAQGPDGERAVRSGLRELTDGGYAMRQQIREEGQRGIARHALLVRASLSLPWPVLQGGFQPVENQPVHNVGLPSNDLPSNDLPSNTSNARAGVKPVASAEQICSDEPRTKLDPGPAEKDSTFDEIWRRWPRKGDSKNPAWKAWDQSRRDLPVHIPQIIAGCLHYADSMTHASHPRGLKGFLKDQEWRDWHNGPPEGWTTPPQPASRGIAGLDLSDIEFDPEPEDAA